LPIFESFCDKSQTPNVAAANLSLTGIFTICGTGTISYGRRADAAGQDGKAGSLGQNVAANPWMVKRRVGSHA
jgi:hypothetical protein